MPQTKLLNLAPAADSDGSRFSFLNSSKNIFYYIVCFKIQLVTKMTKLLVLFGEMLVKNIEFSLHVPEWRQEFHIVTVNCQYFNSTCTCML